MLNHIAFIMDGNSSWAKINEKPQLNGYLEGMRNLSKIALACQELGIKHVTFYAFSTENWNRPSLWVSSFMNLARSFFKEDPSIAQLTNSDIKLKLIGNSDKLDQDIRKILFDLVEETENKPGTTVYLAISYGGRDEIVRTCKKLLEKGLDITEENISLNLDARGIPDPDLIVRTSGQQRLSNFLLWQSSYSELFFTDVLWPDFDKTELQKAIDEFYRRNRTYGK